MPNHRLKVKFQDGYFNKLTIYEYSNQATQLKKINNTLPVLCADKGYRHLENIINNNDELDKVTLMSLYPDATQKYIVMDVKIDTVDPNSIPSSTASVCSVIKCLKTETHDFDENL